MMGNLPKPALIGILLSYITEKIQVLLVYLVCDAGTQIQGPVHAGCVTSDLHPCTCNSEVVPM